MSRLVARAETWERAYEAFQDINFAAFDYDTVKRSILDYVKLHFPETFNDFIESSEFVAIVEVFAYIAELLAYRIDVTAHENFISTAQRKDSILRLAKLVSYSASRALPARGLVKITSVSTTETVVDANGINLANRTIRWNDTSNTNWKDQFILVMNRVLEQEFGTVSPTDRFQIQDVLFEIYSWNLTPLSNGVFTYTASINGTAAPMELVPVSYDSSLGIVERRPQNNANYTFVYGQDGLGDGSDTTGFFCYTKQGQLQRFRTTFDGVTPNQAYKVPVTSVNDTDVWVNAVDAATGSTKNEQSTLPYRKETLLGKSGEWVQVDLAHAQNVIFNTNPRRNKYEIETQSDNSIRILFGDGEFADVPSGTFDIWVRTSLDEDIVVPQASVVNTSSSFTYTDTFGRIQTFSFTYSLIGSLQNASASETSEHVRVTAPAVYYSQDRMVNGEDYNVYMLQDPSILKLRSINRTFAGDSKYIPWHDTSTTYENVKIFGDDGIIYFQDQDDTTSTPVVELATLITNYVEPLLSSTDIFLQLVSLGVPVTSYRRTFNANERVRVESALTPPPVPTKVELYYNLVTYEWYAIKESEDPSVSLADHGWAQGQFYSTPLIKVNQSSIYETSYVITRNARRMVFQSETTNFWNTNEASRVIDYDTLRSSYDQIVVLQANVNHNRASVLQQNWAFDILSQALVEGGESSGLPDSKRLSIIPTDDNQDGIPDFLTADEPVYHKGIADIIMPKYTTTVPNIPVNGSVDLVLPIQYVYNVDNLVRRQNGDILNPAALDYTLDVRVYRQVGDSWVEIPNRPDVNNISIDTYWGVPKSDVTFVWNKIRLYYPIVALAGGVGSTIMIKVNDYVYFNRASTTSEWLPAPTTTDSMAQYVNDALSGTSLWKRHQGRSDLNFAWLHYSPRYHLVDPSPTNLIDTYVITKGYYMSLKRWLEDSLASAPSAVTPLELRTSYGYLLDNKMISDTVVLHPGKIKLLFGTKAAPTLQATFKVVRSADKTLTDNQIKTTIVTTIRNFFNITYWEFGETFYFTELAAAIHAALPTEISSVVLVPSYVSDQFGDMFQVQAREDEVLYPDISVSDIEIVTGYNSTNLRLNG